MGKTYVIGDIHGCHDALLRLLDKVNPDPHEDTLVFLGDYIDRGLQSCQVIELMIQLQQIFSNCITLLGNHEHMFLAFLKGRYQDFYINMGGQETLESYGIRPPFKRENISLEIPTSHKQFLSNLLLVWENNHGIYVHAALSPSRHLSQQKTKWCLWGKDSFLLSDHKFPKPVVYGHTTFANPQMDQYKIGIDTGAVYGGKLTCLSLPERAIIAVESPPKIRKEIPAAAEVEELLTG